MVEEYFKSFKFLFTNSIESSFRNCSLYIICNNHSIFNSIPITILSQQMKKPAVIFDYWNNFTNQRISLPSSINYIGLGNLGKIIRENYE